MAGNGVQMITAVLFDLDETLIAREGAIRAFITDQYRRFAPDLGGLDESTYVEGFLAMEDNGRIPKDQLYPVFVNRMGIRRIDPAQLLEDYRTSYPTYAVMRPGARETILNLKQQGLRTGIVSNGNARVQNAKIDAIGIRGLLDTVVISEAIGLRKPEPEIFEVATANLFVERPDVLFVGDNPEVDIVGAANAGLQTAWLRNGMNWPHGVLPRADADIDAIPELLSYPGK
jgi:putative hydrolase of the HAD superfamily